MSNKAMRLILVVSAAVAASSVFGQSKLTGVHWKKVGPGIELEIQGSDLGKPKATWSSNHRAYTLEFDAAFAGRSASKRVNEAGIRSISWAKYRSNPPKSRVVVSFRSSSDFKPEMFASEGQGWFVAFGQDETAERFSALKAKAQAFPDSVPPLNKPMPMNQIIEKMAASPVNALPPTRGVSPFERKVSLTFEQADIVQILKALALQADVNIVTAPEVNGKFTVALNDVNVQQALDFVTALAGVRYALVGNTFVVTTSERFAKAMSHIYNKPDEVSETRIISLASGEGAQIKATVLKAVPQESEKGRYEILLPTEALKIETKSSEVNAQGSKNDGKSGSSVSGGGDVQKTDINSKADTGPALNARPKDMYLVLIGFPGRLNDVEKVVREVDTRIADASKVVIGKDIATRVIPIYSSRIAEVANAVRRVVDRDPKRELYNIQESDTGQTQSEEPLRLLVISGPVDSMTSVELFARGIDEGLCKSMGVDYPETQEDQVRAYEVFELKYVEPLEAAIELQNRVQGLRATVLPAPVSPMPKGVRSVSQGSGADSGSSSGSGTGSGGGSTSTVASGQNASGSQANLGSSASTNASGSGSGSGSGGGSSSSQDNGYSLTKNLGSEPMKLLVRGTRSQINQAREYLGMFDLPPRQVALELRVMELTKEDALKVGLDWSFLGDGIVRAIRINQGVGGTAGQSGNISTGNPASSLPGDQGWQHKSSSGSVLATLDSLAGTVKLLARPNIIASEGRATSIFIGDEIRYIESIQSSQNGTTITTGQVNVGVRFVVTPRVGSGGNITLDLNPELSLLKGFTAVPGGGNLPQTSLRSTNSVVNIKSGETLAIGGLIQEVDRRTVGGIPFLKDIPLLGWLFKRNDQSKTRSEIVFFLTAKEVSETNRGSAADPRRSGGEDAKAPMESRATGKGN